MSNTGNNEKMPNIYWIIVDSVRTFKTGLDDRDRIDIFDEVASDGIEFLNCTTGSPSSLLSAGTIFTGLPATFVARHFNDWKFKGMEISSLATLKDNFNYQILPILDTRDLREILHTLLPPLRHKDLPKGYRISDYVWHNRDITKIFTHFLERQSKLQNYAYILWYDCRRDKNTNKYVKQAINAIKQRDDFNNSIIIMHSDHGYPDPRTKLDEKYFKNIGHDMVLSDDNIKVPLVMKLPNYSTGIKIMHQIGLIDVLPTVFDVLNINYKKLNTTFQGRSLLSIINGDEEDNRIRKTDTRLPMDVKRIGCLRSNNYKYIYLYNDEIEILYDLGRDPQELTNVVEVGSYNKIRDELREINDKYEEELFLFHDNQVRESLFNSIVEIQKKSSNESPSIVIVTKGIKLLTDILIKQLEGSFLNPKICLIFAGGKKYYVDGVENTYFVDDITPEHIKKLQLAFFDITIFLTENSSRVFLKRSQIEAIKQIGAKNSFLMNYNFELFKYFSSKWLNATYIKLFFDWETKGYFYKQDPLYLIKDVTIFIKYFIIKYKNSISRKRTEMDLKAAREAVYYRKAILETNRSDLFDSMNDKELANEIERLNTRDY